MGQNEFSESFSEWLNLSIEEKYKDSQVAYFEKFPKGSNSDFHLMEIEHWKNRLKEYEKMESREWWETKFVVEGQKMLGYYQKLVASEKENQLLKSTGVGKDSCEKPTVKSYAILHAIWQKYDRTKTITDTNKALWASQYSISQNTLKQQFDRYFEKKDRKPTSNDKRAVLPFIKSFSIAVELIKGVCPEAYEDAKNELSALTKHYQNKTA